MALFLFLSPPPALSLPSLALALNASRPDSALSETGAGSFLTALNSPWELELDLLYHIITACFLHFIADL